MPDNHLLAIPVYNEERYVERVLDEARRYSRHILVIDDGSTDATPDLLMRQGDLHLITHPENRGYGLSLADAFAFTRRRGFDWLITMDCDEQHEASSIPRFLEVAAAGEADVVSGTRYPGGRYDDPDAPSDRRRINRQITEMLRERLGLDITDAFCGFKAYRCSGLETIRVTVPGYAMPLQWWVQVARAGLRVVEVPIRLIYKDPERHFGGLLDDPQARLSHYLSVFEAEMRRPEPQPVPCRCCDR